MTRRLVQLLVLAMFALPATAEAYVGPGAGLSLLGALWGVIAAVGVAVLFVVIWPLRRMLRRRKGGAETTAATSDEASRAAEPDRAPEAGTR